MSCQGIPLSLLFIYLLPFSVPFTFCAFYFFLPLHPGPHISDRLPQAAPDDQITCCPGVIWWVDPGPALHLPSGLGFPGCEYGCP